MWNEDRFSRPSWAERMEERRGVSKGWGISRDYDEPDEVEQPVDEYEPTEEAIEEMEAQSSTNFYDTWTDEEKRRFAPHMLDTYTELESKYGFHFSDEAKAKWRAYL